MRPESFIKKEIYKKQLKILKEKNIYNIRDMTRAEKEKDLSIYNKEMYKIRINPHNKHPYTDSNNVCDWAGKNPNKSIHIQIVIMYAIGRVRIQINIKKFIQQTDIII
jgi:hypothetical protein